MKIIQIIFYLLLGGISPLLLRAQQASVVKEFHTSVIGTYSTNGTVIPSGKAATLIPDDRIALTRAEIKGGDLFIDFELAKSLSREKKLDLLFQPYLISRTGELMAVHPKHLEGDFYLNYSNKDRPSQLKWLDFSENFDWGNDEFELHLQGELRGPMPVNCDKVPEFGMKQKLPHFILAGLSAGMVITGYSLKSSSEKLYDQYRDAIFRGEEGEPANNVIRSIERNSDSLYNQANIRNKNSGFFKIAGYGAFAANGIVFLVRYLRYKSNLKAYQYYCPERSLQVEPALEISSGGVNSGLKINYRF